MLRHQFSQHFILRLDLLFQIRDSQNQSEKVLCPFWGAPIELGVSVNTVRIFRCRPCGGGGGDRIHQFIGNKGVLRRDLVF